MILIVTEPVHRLHSDYIHNRAHYAGPEDKNNYPEGTKTFEELVFKKGTHSVNESYEPVRRGQYYKGMEIYLKYFKRNQMLILDGERFTMDPLYGLKQAEQFLGIQSYFNENHFLFDTTKGFWCLRASGCMGTNKGRPHPELPERTLTALYEYYRVPNRKFRKLAGLDFDWLSSIPVKSSSNNNRKRTSRFLKDVTS